MRGDDAPNDDDHRARQRVPGCLQEAMPSGFLVVKSVPMMINASPLVLIPAWESVVRHRHFDRVATAEETHVPPVKYRNFVKYLLKKLTFT